MLSNDIVRSRPLHQELTSRNYEPKNILWSLTPREWSAHSHIETNRKVEDAVKHAGPWGSSHNYDKIEEQQVEYGPVRKAGKPLHVDRSTRKYRLWGQTASRKWENGSPAILYLVQHAVEQLSRAVTLFPLRKSMLWCMTSWNTSTSIRSRIQIVMLWETIEKPLNSYLESYKGAGSLRRRAPCHEDFLAPIGSYIHAKTLDAIADQRKDGTLRAPSVETSTKRESVVATGPRWLQKAPVSTSSESSSAETNLLHN